MPDHRHKAREETLRAENDLMVLCADVGSHLPRILQLTVLIFVISHGESLHRAGTLQQRGSDCGNRTRVKTAAEKDPQWNVTPQMNAHGLGKQLLETLDILGFRERLLR